MSQLKLQLQWSPFTSKLPEVRLSQRFLLRLMVSDDLPEWLQLMLAEIARKQEEEQRAAEEQQARAASAMPPEPQTAQSG